MKAVNAASAVVPCVSHEQAMALISEGLHDPLFGQIRSAHVQLCPQHCGYLHEATLERLIDAYPNTQFRLHASPKLKGEGRAIVYASNLHEERAYLARMVAMTRLMGSSGYSIHAGRRDQNTLSGMIDNAKLLEDAMGTRTSVEGLYPTPRNTWLMSDWEEYEAVLRAGIGFALDLSHLNILVRRQGRRDDLVKEMIASPACVEVHISHNDGRADSHLPLDPASPPWWYDMLELTHAEAELFYEGVLVLPAKTKR